MGRAAAWKRDFQASVQGWSSRSHQQKDGQPYLRAPQRPPGPAGRVPGLAGVRVGAAQAVEALREGGAAAEEAQPVQGCSYQSHYLVFKLQQLLERRPPLCQHLPKRGWGGGDCLMWQGLGFVS